MPALREPDAGIGDDHVRIGDRPSLRILQIRSPRNTTSFTSGSRGQTAIPSSNRLHHHILTEDLLQILRRIFVDGKRDWSRDGSGVEGASGMEEESSGFFPDWGKRMDDDGGGRPMGPFIPPNDPVPVYDTHTVQHIVSQICHGTAYDPNGYVWVSGAIPGPSSPAYPTNAARSWPFVVHRSRPKLIERKRFGEREGGVKSNLDKKLLT
jgi:hypothetical protein